VASQVIQQRGLSYARFTVYHERPAFTGSHGLNQFVEHSALGTAIGQLRRTGPRREACRDLHRARLPLAIERNYP
jgi:hypothetical protein